MFTWSGSVFGKYFGVICSSPQRGLVKFLDVYGGVWVELSFEMHGAIWVELSFEMQGGVWVELSFEVQRMYGWSCHLRCKGCMGGAVIWGAKAVWVDLSFEVQRMYGWICHLRCKGCMGGAVIWGAKAVWVEHTFEVQGAVWHCCPSPTSKSTAQHYRFGCMSVMLWGGISLLCNLNLYRIEHWNPSRVRHRDETLKLSTLTLLALTASSLTTMSLGPDQSTSIRSRSNSVTWIDQLASSA